MQQWYTVKNQLPNTAAVEIHIDNEIGEFGIPARNFINDLKAHSGEQIRLHINSPGGSLIDAFAIYDYMKLKGIQLSAYIHGIAASAATVISSAAREVFIGEHSYFFIHNPYFASGYSGPGTDLEKMKADLLDIYQKKTGLDTTILAKMMDEETLLSAQEALDLGFVDGIAREAKVAAKVRQQFSIKRLAEKAPKQQLARKERQLSRVQNAGKPFSERLLEQVNQLNKFVRNAYQEEGEEQLDFIPLEVEDGSTIYVVPDDPNQTEPVEGNMVLQAPEIEADSVDDSTYTLTDGSQIEVKQGIIHSIIKSTVMNNADVASQLEAIIQQMTDLMAVVQAGGEEGAPAAPPKGKDAEQEAAIQNLTYELAKIKAQRVSTQANARDNSPAAGVQNNTGGWDYISKYLQRNFR